MTCCPKCRYTRTADDKLTPAGVCPACGIVYAKYDSARETAAAKRGQDQDPGLKIEYAKSTGERIHALLFGSPPRVDPVVFWARVACFAVFFVWGGWFIATNGSWGDIGNSFMHSINLAFHEAGHVVFIPFGRFMTILGGSLFQIMVPLIVLVFFLRQGDRFEAAMMLWWCGQNFIDISPYIADAEHRGLPLILGMGEESHDWGNLLTMLDMVDKAYAISRASFITGCAIIVISLAWGGYVLWRQKRNTTAW